jgi:DNA-binding Xre family transcriptional regulator
MAEHDRDQFLEVEGRAPADVRGRPAPPTDRTVDVAAVAACIRDMVDHSGDDVATVASHLGVEPAWAEGLLTGEVAEVDFLKVQRICLALELRPSDLFGVPDISGRELVVPPPGADADLRLPAGPVVARIAFLQAETGDDLDTVSRGLAVEPAWLHAVVNGEIDWLSGTEVGHLCTGFGLSPRELLGPAGSALEEEKMGQAGMAEVRGAEVCGDRFPAGATRPGEPDGPSDLGS